MKADWMVDDLLIGGVCVLAHVETCSLLLCGGQDGGVVGLHLRNGTELLRVQDHRFAIAQILPVGPLGILEAKRMGFGQPVPEVLAVNNFMDLRPAGFQGKTRPVDPWTVVPELVAIRRKEETAEAAGLRQNVGPSGSVHALVAEMMAAEEEEDSVAAALAEELREDEEHKLNMEAAMRRNQRVVILTVDEAGGGVVARDMQGQLLWRHDSFDIPWYMTCAATPEYEVPGRWTAGKGKVHRRWPELVQGGSNGTQLAVHRKLSQVQWSSDPLGGSPTKVRFGGAFSVALMASGFLVVSDRTSGRVLTTVRGRDRATLISKVKW